MRTSSRFLGALAAAAAFVPSTLGQNNSPITFTDATTGIVFNSWTIADGSETKGGFTFGVALPDNALTTDASEFIGYLSCASTQGEGTGWCGISLGGAMTNSLLITAWPSGGEIYTSFRFATGYVMPDVYTGNAQLTQISTNINSTHFTLIFRCQNCLSWNQDGVTGSASTSAGALVLAWAQANPSPGNPTCPDQIVIEQHDNGQSTWGAVLDSHAANPSYTAWAAKATKTVAAQCGTATATGVASVPVPTGATYDYVVVGGGAGGIPMADKLSQAGHKVLLIEKGFASTGENGGTLGPAWLSGTGLTRFDVPGLCNEIWVDSKGIACDDTDQMAGCVLGGGTAVNAGLWFHPYSLDFDYLFPTGWQSKDMQTAISRVFSRIPGTYTPSMDGQLYYHQGFNVLAGGLGKGGWSSVVANSVPDSKNRTYSVAPFMFSNGQRGGPLHTYLQTAKARSNFDLWLNTSVKRVVRDGGHATGLEVEAFLDGGYEGTVNLTAITGRVILSAGTFGTAKLLLRSGIGPTDQLQVVQNSTDGPTMVSNTSWIPLPVGYNLDDHCNTDTVITHPDVVFYDFYAAWSTPIASDENSYLKNRTGILAQAAPNIGPMMWDQIKGADGIVRQLQWTSRVEGSFDTPSGHAMTISQYLGRGATSRGRMTITPALDTVVSDVPYLKDPNDKAAVIQGIINLQNALKNVANLTWTYPNSSTTVQDYVNNMVVAPSNRRANHWVGTAKIGSDDGRTNSGSAVVDLNAKVYGTDNIFVVDASIFPGVPTTNPSAYIVTVAEHASDKILALAAPTPVAKYGQCGGLQWTGSFICATGSKCTYQNAWYSQCL